MAEGCRCFGETFCPHSQCANVSEELVAFIFRAEDRKLKMLISIYQTAQRHVPGDSNVLRIPHTERNFVGKLYLATIPSAPMLHNDHGTNCRRE